MIFMPNAQSTWRGPTMGRTWCCTPLVRAPCPPLIQTRFLIFHFCEKILEIWDILTSFADYMGANIQRLVIHHNRQAWCRCSPSVQALWNTSHRGHIFHWRKLKAEIFQIFLVGKKFNLIYQQQSPHPRWAFQEPCQSPGKVFYHHK